jgi:hypothetical protein
MKEKAEAFASAFLLAGTLSRDFHRSYEKHKAFDLVGAAAFNSRMAGQAAKLLNL